MKYLFFVQGEGRGHLTQALTLKERLENRGHQVVAIIVGVSNQNLPTFFQEQIKIPLFQLTSPSFAVAKDGKGIEIFSSVWRAIRQAPLFIQSLKKIKTIIKDTRPDVLVSFYEPLAAIYYRLYHDKRPLFCLGHQYFIGHPQFVFPPRQRLARFSFKFYNYLNAPRRAIKIALSFTAADDHPETKLFVCPPLIRQIIKDQKPDQQNFILIYILNPGYSEEIIKWAKANPHTMIEAFWSREGQDQTQFGSNLNFHRLSGEKFISRLADCRAYASSGGFDSISEAAYLQKNIMMVPTKNHYEQKCNALDAERAGLAIAAPDFNLSLISADSNPLDDNKTQALKKFKAWVDNYDEKLITLLEK